MQTDKEKQRTEDFTKALREAEQNLNQRTMDGLCLGLAGLAKFAANVMEDIQKEMDK